MKRLLAAALLVVSLGALAQYPQRPIQLIVPWGAGGGTDATARVIGGYQAIASAQADGYTIGMITVEIAMMHHIGLTALKHTDYAPIGLVNADPAGINVRVDSPYKSVKALLAAIKASPGKMKASGTGQGGVWHLAIAGLQKH